MLSIIEVFLSFGLDVEVVNAVSNGRRLIQASYSYGFLVYAEGRSVSSCYAASAACAKRLSRSKNALDWPLNSPSSVRPLTAPIAAPFVSVGRIIEQLGKVLLRNGHGSGMIRFACNVCG